MMACGLSKSPGFTSSLKKPQGIVTILGGSDGHISSNTSSAPSIRQTFSADLSSKNWVSPRKEKLDEEGSRSGPEIWAQIQEEEKEIGPIGPAQSDVWSSILSDKKKDDVVPPPPYVHPLVKRASSLSEKSLEICTESLGSETGCEGFGSFADSEIEETEEAEQEAITVPNQTTCTEFPPPIRSLSGSALHMKTRRDNGRLVLEAVSMPLHNNFSAKREHGRLLLTFSNEPNYEIDLEEEEEVEDEFAYKPSGLIYNLTQKPIGPVTVHRLAHKPIGVPKTNSRWPESETKTDLSTPVVHSLPPRPRVAQLARSMKPPSTVDDTVGAACFNTCDYSWKLNNTETLGRNIKTQFQSQNYVNKSIGVGNEVWINGCKERRRSLLSVEPFCIATS